MQCSCSGWWVHRADCLPLCVCLCSRVSAGGDRGIYRSERAHHREARAHEASGAQACAEEGGDEAAQAGDCGGEQRGVARGEESEDGARPELHHGAHELAAFSGAACLRALARSLRHPALLFYLPSTSKFLSLPQLFYPLFFSFACLYRFLSPLRPLLHCLRCCFHCVCYIPLVLPPDMLRIRYLRSPALLLYSVRIVCKFHSTSTVWTLCGVELLDVILVQVRPYRSQLCNADHHAAAGTQEADVSTSDSHTFSCPLSFSSSGSTTPSFALDDRLCLPWQLSGCRQSAVLRSNAYLPLCPPSTAHLLTRRSIPR